jgi:hypothetical protein
VRALAIIGTVCVAPVLVTMLAVAAFAGAASWLTSDGPQRRAAAAVPSEFASQPRLRLADTAAARPVDAPDPAEDVAQPPAAVNMEIASIQARVDMEALASIIDREKANGVMPADVAGLYAKATERNPGEPEPRDPFAGQRYSYEPRGAHYMLRSVGPDKVLGTADDIVRDSRER